MHGTATVPPPQRSRKRRAFWLKQLHTWHWMSSALSLIGLLLFALTGFTLNHAGAIEGSATTSARAAQLPPPLLRLVRPDGAPDAKKPLPPPISAWVGDTLGLSGQGVAEWSADEIYLGLPTPGGDGWVAIDRATGKVTSERTSRGWVAYLNDLHKGRNAGPAWSLFIDLFVGACVIFSLTGLVLLQLHSARRRSTWPLVGLGLAIPAAVAIVFIH